MDTQPPFGLQQLLRHIVGDMARAVSQRHDELPPRQFARAQAAAQAILAFGPRDAIEAMIAGHCMMFHELIVDSVQITLRGEVDSTRRATRSGIVAMDRAFGANLVRLERYRTRHAGTPENTQRADAQPGGTQPGDTQPGDLGETEIADRVHRHQSRTGAPRTAATHRETAAASPDPIAPCPADSTATARPGALYPARSPAPDENVLDTRLLDARVLGEKVLGLNPPREARPAATASMPGLNRQARREIGRQARKHIDPGTPASGTSAILNATLGVVPNGHASPRRSFVTPAG